MILLKWKYIGGKISKDINFNEKDCNNFLLNKLEKIIAVLRLLPLI